jgi:hypothetical protein
MHQGALIMLSECFLTEALQDEWNKIFKVMKEKQPTKLSFKNDGEIEVSPAKQKLREFVTYLTKILRMIL